MDNNKTKMAIYGAGSLGTILGAYITKSGKQIDLINRNREHIEGLRQHGAQIRGTVHFDVPVNALYPEEMNGTYDIIFLLTKQQDNDSVVRFLKPFLSEDGVLVSMQNGLPEPAIANIIGKERTVGCAIAWGATLLGKGASELTSDPDSLSFSLGAFDPTEKLNLIKEVLNSMGTVVIEDNFMGARWSKLLINCAFSGLSTVLGCTFGTAAADTRPRRYLQKLIKECIDVAAAANIRIEPVQGKNIASLMDYHGIIKQKAAFLLIPLLIRKHRFLKASMLQDLEQGKKTEVDAINGVVSAFGKKYSVSTPCNDLVVSLIHRIEQGELRPDMNNIHFFEELQKHN